MVHHARHSEQEHLQSIRNTYPDISIQTSEVLARGQQCDTYVINDEFVFRFPKYREDYNALARESSILQSIHSLLPVAIPVPIFERLDGCAGPPFIGYKMVPGVPLRREMLAAIKDLSIRQRLALQLASFLAALHAPATLRAAPPGLRCEDTPRKYELMYETIRLQLFDHMSGAARVATTRLFESYLNSGGGAEYLPCLRHGDFGPTNILVDIESATITGILDFGHAGVGDPAYDLAGVACYGDAFLEMVGAEYPHFESLRARAKFYKETFALQEALYGLEYGDTQAFERGIACFR